MDYKQLITEQLTRYNQEACRLSVEIQERQREGKPYQDLKDREAIIWTRIDLLHTLRERSLQDVEPVTSQVGINAAGDAVRMSIGTEEEETEGQYAVRLCALGMSINFEMPTPEDALNLYNALLKVKEVEAD